ncbi:MAG: ATP-binding protein, partial [Actinobacteria bacterium]|nr:ATP-binding protein [Actinomycetota bacterium]
AEGARSLGLELILCAPESAAEAELAGVQAVPVRHIGEAVAYLRGELQPAPAEPPAETAEPEPPDLADVRGQERARRALELAAAGGHNLLLAGPPGTGKTMLGRRLPGILPLLALPRRSR